MTKEEILEKCLSIEFPQTVLTDNSLKNNIRYLFSYKCSSKNSNTCMQLIQHFHPSMWKANKNGFLSPYNAWYDIDCLAKAIDNRLKYKGNDLSPRDIRAGLTLSFAGPKVSIFKPALAKYIINKYLDKYVEVFDPCSGYSGRLLGAASLKKKYIGQDINSTTVKESNNLIAYFNLNECRVTCKNSIASKGSYECLFTCPPYGDKENWNQDIEQLSCDEWIDICLKNYKCDRYVFVVDKTDKYAEYVAEVIDNNSHINKNSEYIIVIDK